MANTSYNRIIRKLVVGFGNLFKDITLVRYNGDNSEAERFVVPIAYAAKEMYVQRLESDPDLDKKVSTTLPSFEKNIIVGNPLTPYLFAICWFLSVLSFTHINFLDM